MAKRRSRVSHRFNFSAGARVVMSTRRIMHEAVDPNTILETLRKVHAGLTLVPLTALALGAAGNVEAKDLAYTQHGFAAACRAVDLKRDLVFDVSETDPDLAARLFNNRLKAMGGALQGVVSDGRVEGVVSTDYGRLPNINVAEALLEKHPLIQSFCLEGTRMRLTTFRREDLVEVQRGDLIGQGVSVRNSEDGRWGFAVNNYLLRLACTNGMTTQVQGIAQSMAHRGADTIMDRGRYMLDKATLTDANTFEKIRESLTVTLSQDDIDNLNTMLTGKGYSSASLIRIMAEAKREMERWNFKTMSLYAYWNGVTAETHHTESLDRIVDIQQDAREVLDYRPKA